jgi:LmbE family N-acetylglucosaminyl deacetylase
LSEKVLVIAPHCDDESFGLGGTILKLTEAGVAVYVVAVVAGDVRFEHNSNLSIPRSTRVVEFETVLAAYGCRGEVLPFHEESRLDTVPTVAVVNAIENVQDVVQADAWYIPGPSFHQDHRRVWEACLAAMRPTRERMPREVYVYETPVYAWNPPQMRLTPHVYENIEAQLDRKIEICRMYASQHRTGALSPEHIREYSRGAGSEAGFPAAERFEVLRLHRP